MHETQKWMHEMNARIIEMHEYLNLEMLLKFKLCETKCETKLSEHENDSQQ
jgi:hypothetical protein